MVRDAVLHPGDQLCIGRHRFVLEAPGFPLRGQHATTPPPLAASAAASAAAVPVHEGDRSGIWWLLFAAALIGVGIAALLMFGGR